MPAYSGNKRNFNSDDRKRWNNTGGGRRDGRNDGRSLQNRMMQGGGAMISPWESGMAPGATASSLLGDFQSSVQNQLLMNRVNMAGNNYNMPNKIRRLDGIGNFGDHRSRGGLLPSPNTSLMGVAPQNFLTSSRSSNLQQRLGNTWSSAPKRSGSSYYPSDSRRDNNRRQNRQSPQRSRNDNRDKHRPRYSDKRSKETNKDKASSKDRDDAKSPLKDESEISKENKEEPTDTKEKEKETVPIEEKRDEFPAEALFCHVCNLEPFTTKKGYIRHLEGITHTRMAEKFHEKNAALLDYLNAAAKFAEVRRKDKLLRSSGCKGLPLGRVIEKIILKKFLNLGSCCGKKFTSLFDFHEHKLSVHHLRDMFEQGQCEKNIVTEEVETLNEASIDRIDEIIKSAKEAIVENPLNVENVPIYDPKSPFGLQFIDKNVRYKCSICNDKEYFNSLEEHCQSMSHYESIVAALNKEEEKKMEEEKKRLDEEKEREKEAKEEKEEPKQKYERHSNEEECESIYSDKNEDDSRFVSYEDYMKDDEDMIILDEEKNDDALNEEPQVVVDEEKNEDMLNDEPETILDDMADEAMVEDNVQVVGEDFNEEEEDKEIHEVEDNEQQDEDDDEVEIIADPPKRASPRRSSRMRL